MAQQEKAMLILWEGQTASQSWVLDKELITIGRWGDNDIVLPDRMVSRHHAQIQREGEQYILQDQGSKNGTFVNGQELTGPYVLQDGDEIQLALRFKLSFVGSEATAPLRFKAGPMGLRLDKERKAVWVEGQELLPPLSPAQYSLLQLLYENAGKVCSREEIIEAVWPETAARGVSDQAIDALVRRLRDRIKEVAPHHQYVVTVRGHGFRLNTSHEGS